MPRNRRYLVKNQVLFITTRTEAGLPFVATTFMNIILWGVLARATQCLNIKVCHFIFLANHLHLILVVQNPEDVPAFMREVKKRSARMFNRLRGRRKRTIWEAGYDTPVVLDPHKTIEKIRYIYNNPAAAALVEKIDQYPGVSSWKMYRKRVSTKVCPWLQERAVPVVPRRGYTAQYREKLARLLVQRAAKTHVFRLHPDAWQECFEECRDWDMLEVNRKLVRELRREQRRLARQRRQAGQGVVGAAALQAESIYREYVPQKHGLRMLCLSVCKELRVDYIAAYRAGVLRCEKVFSAWKLGDYRRRIPAGFIPPGRPVIVNRNPLFAW